MSDIILKPELITKNNAGLIAQLDEIVRVANEVQITDREIYKKALDSAKVVKELRKEAKNIKDILKREAIDYNDKVDDKFNSIDKPLKGVEETYKKKLLEFDRQEAARAAEAERLRKAEEDRLLSEAKKAEESNNPVAAEVLLETAVEKSQEIVAPAAIGAKTDYATGSRKKGPWKIQVVDIKLVDPKYLLVDESAVRKDAIAGQTDFPGLKVWQEETYAIR